MDELRLAIRRLTKRPGATLASVVTLACAIGAAAATWSLVSAVLLRPLPVKAPDRLMVLGSRDATGPDSATLRNGFIYPVYPIVRDSGVFEQVVAQWAQPEGLLVGSGALPVLTRVGFASHDFFNALGVPIRAGRGFAPDDDRRGAAPVAILLDRYWRRTFNADPGAIGRTISVRGKPVTIVGVAAKGFRGLDLAEAPDLYLPLHTIGDVGYPTMNHFAEPNLQMAPTSGIAIIGRLRAGQTAEQALQRLTTLALLPAERRAQFGFTDISTAAIPTSARDGMRQFTTLLTVTVGLLLLIGCGTVGMLMLIRTEARREEFAMCLALGASRARLARGIAIEGALLSLAGALASLPVALWLFDGLRAFQLPGGVDIGLLDLSIDRAALAAAGAGAIAGTLLITLVAGAFGFSANVADALRSRGGATPRASRRRTRAALVAGQVAVSLVLLAGAGLFARSLATALRLNTDVDMARVVTGDVSLSPYGYDTLRASAFFDDLFARLSGNPSVRSVAFSVFAGGMTSAGRTVVDGVPRRFPSMVSDTVVDPHYFRTMGIRLLRGRDFSRDDRSNAPRVTIVSESFGRMLANGGDPIGHRITMTHSRIGQPPDVLEVVGVVPDVVTRVSVLEPLVEYLPMAQSEPETYRTITVRAATGADATRREIVSAIKEIDPSVFPSPLLTLEERIGRQMSAQRFGAMVLGVLGVIAVLLTVLGTYVLAESMAVLRMREMGIRAALGASGRQLGAIVLAETARLVGLGVVLGLGLVWMGASTIRAFLFQIQPLDPTTLAAVAALILTLAMIVSLRPALRAARVDLRSVLKEE